MIPKPADRLGQQGDGGQARNRFENEQVEDDPAITVHGRTLLFDPSGHQHSPSDLVTRLPLKNCMEHRYRGVDVSPINGDNHPSTGRDRRDCVGRPSSSGTGPVHDSEARLRDRMIRDQADTTGTGHREQSRTHKMWRAVACPKAVSEGDRGSSALPRRKSSPFLVGGISNDWGCWPSVERRRRAENCRRSLQDEAGHARLGWVAALGCS